MNTIIGRAMVAGGGGTNKVPQIFGDGSDGAVIISSNTTWNAETEDTGMIVKNFESLTIPNGVTVSAGNRNCGMIIRVQGDCTIDGTLANKLSCKTLLSSDNVDFSSWPLTMLIGKAGDGGAGGDGGYTMGSPTTQGKGGTGMTGRFYGGGWSGGGAGAGYAADSWTKDVGGKGGSADTITTATPDSDLFKAGENQTYHAGSAGTHYGNDGVNGGGGGCFTYGDLSKVAVGPGGSPPDFKMNASGGTSGGNGNIGGGVIILLVGGNLTITGEIDCSGGAGGHGGNKTAAVSEPGGGGAGGAGGGRIFICHQGTISNTGTLNVAGGAAGAAGNPTNLQGQPGTAGTDGTTAIKTYDQYLEEDVA